MLIKTKLCGFKNKADIDLACQLGVDFIGIVFCKSSPRYVDSRKSGEILKDVSSDVKKVAVIVDFDDDQIQEIIDNCHFDFLQLHGGENNDRIKSLKKKFNIKIIKAIRISTSEDLKNIDKFIDADYLLFDAKNPGAGCQFDWGLISSLNIKKDWFLSGGINIENISEAINKTNAKMIDISSGIEEKKGVKSPNKIKKLLKFVKKLF